MVLTFSKGPRFPRRALFPLAVTGSPWIRAQTETRPNILFLLTDDQRWDSLGCMGNGIIQTPHVDRLARDGVTFDNNFCTTAICMTSRVSILTGLHERSHRISSFSEPLTPQAMAASYPALLRDAGYHTGLIGKYGIGAKLPNGAFDYFEAFPGQGQYEHQRASGPAHLTHIQQEQAVKFFRTAPKQKPFCLSVSFKAPHVQDGDPRQFIYDAADEQLYSGVTIPTPRTASEQHYRALPEFLKNSEGRTRWKLQFADPEMYQRSVKGYYRLITGVDRAVGNMLAALRDSGRLDNTVVIFTSDNGYFLGEHGLSHKWYLHEESVRTPLIVWDPRLSRASRGQRRREMTLNIDLAPTMLKLAGVEPPPAMQGRDLAALLRGPARNWRREWFYSHLFQHPAIPKSEGIRTEDWAYIRWLDQKTESLFHVRNDPGNTNDLAGTGKARRQLEALRRRWETWDRAFANWSPDRPWRDPL
jgi:arylsulfatase A-like enzyme